MSGASSWSFREEDSRRIDEILTTGLHAFLTQFLDRVNDLGGRISRDFLIANGSGR